MDGARWDRVQELFHEARALRGEARERRLAQGAAGDPALRREVEELLLADERTSSVLDGGVERVAGRLLAEPEAPPRELGPYRITGELGRGGMGVVYRAERGDLGRAVAVKVLRDGWLSPERRERFAAEQRILARLEHPAIARLYEADVLADGTPWFAMELVDGVPITAWCEGRGSALAERLALFRAACEAVAFAQRHAVVHRDLKPSNLLVDAAGQVKLLDFGIARHLEPADAGAEPTRTGVRLMTPAYAAPEQLRGEPPGLPTDVWALGVLLYELAAGRRPFDRPDRSQAEVELAVLREEPERPSAVARRAGRALGAGRGTWQELDVVCLGALRKEPHRRYASAEALLRDVDHLLSGRPLDARPDRATYRLAKFAGRHRVEVTAAALAVLALAGTVAAFTVRLARARDDAVAEAARAQHVQGFLRQLLSGGDQAAGPSADLKVVDLLAAGEREVEALGADPATQADLLATLGATAERLGLLDRADALLGRALERHRALPGGAASAVVSDLQEIGRLRFDQARYDEAATRLAEAVALARASLPAGHPGLAAALLLSARNDAERDRLPAAVAAAEEAVRLRGGPGVPPLELAEAVSQLSDVRFAEGRREEGEALAGQALALLRGQLGERHQLVGDRLARLGWARQDTSQQRQAVAIYEAWYGHLHPKTIGALSELGQNLSIKQELDEAERIDREVLDAQVRLRGERHPDTAAALYALAMVAYFRKDYDEAVRRCRQATAIWAVLGDEQRRNRGMGLACEVNAVYRQGKDPALAERLARQSLAVFRELYPPGHEDVVIAEGRLGNVLLQAGRPAEAAPLIRPHFALSTKLHGRTSPWAMEEADLLALALRGAGQAAEADALEVEQRALRAAAASQTAAAR